MENRYFRPICEGWLEVLYNDKRSKVIHIDVVTTFFKNPGGILAIQFNFQEAYTRVYYETAEELEKAWKELMYLCFGEKNE